MKLLGIGSINNSTYTITQVEQLKIPTQLGKWLDAEH
jgi:hypothetical protein